MKVYPKIRKSVFTQRHSNQRFSPVIRLSGSSAPFHGFARLLPVFFMLMFSQINIQGQTVVFFEDFENTSSLAVTSSGTPGWGISTLLAAGGIRSDSANCSTPGDSSVLVTALPVITTGFGYVLLEFDHICKIEFYDAAYIEVSGNGGTTWTRLTGAHYLGTGQFVSGGNKFNSTSYLDWLPGNPSPPTNSWWKHEYFDISSIAGNSNSVLVRFILKDENFQNIFDNYAWFLDNIKITAALSELTPPSITLIPPVLQGLKFSLGPYPIPAQITDTSGVDTALVVYRVNHGTWDTTGMASLGNNLFQGTIPPVNDLDTIDYYIVAIDGSLSHNTGTWPSPGYLTAIASSGLYTPYFNDFETADSLWIPSGNTASTRWEWGAPAYGVLTGAWSGQSAWTINKDSLYGNSATTTLTSPYYNFTQATNLVLSFRQNRNTESRWDGMHLEYTTDELNWYLLGVLNDPAGENWYTDTIYATGGSPAWEGSSGGWIRSSYRLTLLNNVPMVRFRFVFNSDPYVVYEGVSIDDFSISPRPAVDLAMKEVLSPQKGCQLGLETVSVKIRNEGLDTLHAIPLRYHVAGAPFPVQEIVQDTLFPDSSMVFNFATPVNLAVTGNDSLFQIAVYVNLPADTLHENDTLAIAILSGSIPTDPVAVHQTIPYATATQVTAVSSDSLFWFDQPAGGNLLHIGQVLQTPILYDSATWWVEARAGIGTLRFTELTLESTGAGSTNPYPSYIPPSTQWDGIEITNTGESPVDLDGYLFHMQGYKAIDYALPSGLVLMPGELLVLSIYAFPAIPADSANRFFVAGNQSVFGSSQLGFWLEAPDGSVEDAFAVNGYPFPAGSPVTAAHWSGTIPTATGKAGVIRIYDDSNTASDWVLADQPSPIQTIGAYNPQLNPVTSLGCPGNRVPVNVYMASYPPLDAGVVTIITPVSATGLTAAETLSIVGRNYGTQQISGFNLSFSLDGAAPVTETYTAAVQPGDTFSYSFLTTLDLSAYQIYQLKVWVSLTSDTVPINDTLERTIIHLLPPFCTSSAMYNSLADIGSVEIGSFINNSPSGLKLYTDYTHLPPVSLIQGLNYPMTVNMQPQTSYNYIFGIKVFIDLDGDGNFDPLTETLLSGLTSSTQTSVSGILSIPYGAKTGLARMRVVMMYTSNLANVLPCGTYNYGETEDYTVMIHPPLAFDAGVVGISSFNPPLIEGSVINMSAWIKNLGSDTLSQIPVGWIITGGSPNMSTLNATLNPGDSILHLLPVPLTVPHSVFALKVFTDLPNDQYRINDTISQYLLGEKDYTPFFFDDFETEDNNGWVSEQISLWQHGVPNASLIKTAHSPTRVWTTRLTGNYLNNVQKGLISPEINITGQRGLSLRFWHWYETEYGFDGGSVKYSLDGGNTFITLGLIDDPLGVNWYNAFASGKFSFSGSTGKWVYSSFDLSAFENQPNPIRFKFDFFSNATLSYNGWAIDDFMISVEKDSIDAGINAIMQPILTIPQGNTFKVTVRIKNYGKTTLYTVPLAFTINGGPEIQATWTGTLQPGNTITYQVPTAAISPGYMELKAYTKVSGDQYTFNDAVTKEIGHVGVHTPDESLFVTVYPNPASGVVNLRLNLPGNTGAKGVLQDMTGRVLAGYAWDFQPGINDEILDVSGLAPGIYLLMIETDFGMTSARVMVL
ncbi:MAG: GEVED domain-containing protein [Bacteroidales bacterium]